MAGFTIADRFRLKRLIGVGGTGWVWEAKDLHTKELVALKVLRDDVSEDVVTQARFRREADTIAALDHPGIARFVDYGHFTDDVVMPGQTITYLATEFIPGEPLDAVIHKNVRVPLERALDILEGTSRALGHAHAAGVVHRDVKPSNILVMKNGTAKLTDFGIARISGEATLTHAGIVMGTAHYVSPEQALGDGATPASDVYSLAVVGYEMITGRKLFTGDGPVALATSHIEHEPDPLPDEAGVRIQALIARSLAKDPSRRPQDGLQFAREIAAARRPETAGFDGGAEQVGGPAAEAPSFVVRRRPRLNERSVPTIEMPIAESVPAITRVSRRLKKLRRK
ncbi:MAG: serine/threonine-protein kinase [Mycobacterium sp.]